MLDDVKLEDYLSISISMALSNPYNSFYLYLLIAQIIKRDSLIAFSPWHTLKL